MQSSLSLIQDLVKRNHSGNLMEFTPFGYMWTTVNTKKLVVSHTIYALLEKEPYEEFITVQKWRSYIHPKDLYKFLQAEEELLHSGKPTLADYRLITATGKQIYVNHHMFLSGVPEMEQKITSIVQNITHQKSADIILEAMSESFFELDENLVFRKINHHAQVFWHLENKYVVGQELTKIFQQIEGTPFHKLLIKALSKKTSIAQDVIDPVTNHWLHLSVSPYSDGLIVIFYDIQNEKDAVQEMLRMKDELLRKTIEEQAEKALREAEEKYRTKLEKEVEQRTEEIIKQHTILKQAEELADAGSWEYNIKTKEFFWSDGMYRLFNIKKGEPVEPKVYIDHALEDDLPIAKKIVDAIEKTFEPFEETMRINFDGSYRTIRVKSNPFRKDGEIEKMLGVDLDISALHRSGETIMGLNNSLSNMNEELLSLNHELKNFNSITAHNYSEALRHVYINLETIISSDARNLSNTGRANLRRAQAAIQKMNLLTSDITNYLQLYDIGINKTLIDPNNILERVVEGLRTKIEESNAKVEIAGLSSINADPFLFFKLMSNLIENSIKFRKPEAEPLIKINYSEATGRTNDHGEIMDKKYGIISVVDKGVGFQREDVEKMFELFIQLENVGKPKGSGIGLAICKKIMQMHGGFITARGDTEGAQFDCCFPV